jgi:putative PIN family toxin of toxin-antitoxin system
VVDTNVFTRACIGGGASSDVIEACLRKRTTAFIGASLLLEYRDVIERPDIFKEARLNLSERGRLLRAFVSRCEWQTVSYKWRPNLCDEGDNHELEFAIAANASMIVTRNVADFLRSELKFPQSKSSDPFY